MVDFNEKLKFYWKSGILFSIKIVQLLIIKKTFEKIVYVHFRVITILYAKELIYSLRVDLT